MCGSHTDEEDSGTLFPKSSRVLPHLHIQFMLAFFFFFFLMKLLAICLLLLDGLSPAVILNVKQQHRSERKYFPILDQTV